MTTFTKSAKWIGLGDSFYSNIQDSSTMQLRTTFFADFQNQKAECLICGLGYYTLYINGKKVGDDVLSPGFTNYTKRALFMRYDVGRYLTNGKNVVAVKLGNGFFNQTTNDTWKFFHATWRNNPRLLFELFIGGNSVCASDNTWKFTQEGATTKSAVRTGEFFDARKDDKWQDLDYDDSHWKNANVLQPIGGELEEQTMPPIREFAKYKPVRTWLTKNGKMYDFGKNISGYVRLKMQASRGETAIIRYGERLKGDELDQSNINPYVQPNDDFSQDRYTFKGNGVEEWKPEFVYHGFQYVEVSGLSTPPPDDAFTAIFVHTDLKQTGDLTCSDSLLNWIYEVGIRSFLSNYHSFPEDCPHREKNGWTGDAALSSGYACKLFDMKEAYKKWLKDVCDTQLASGQICGIAPTPGWGYHWGSGPAWDYALFILPYRIYLETGDTDCIKIVYSAAKKYLDYAKYYEDDNGLVCFGLGDWCPPSVSPPKELENHDWKIVDNRLSDSCYYYSMLTIMQKMAILQGETELANTYATRAEYLKTAIQKVYIQDENVDNGGQGAMAMVLYFDIVNGNAGKAIAKKLVKTLQADGYKHQVGILGMNALLGALTKYGYSDIAYKSIARYDYPSYGYWKNQGATSLWEHWSDTASRNHHMYGTVLHWIFTAVCGLQNTGVAYDTCTLQPLFFDETCFSSVKTQTPRGEIAFDWKKENGKFTAQITLPTGTKATLILPNGHTRYLTSSENLEILL